MRVLEVIIPFIIAGFGTCFAGILLDHVQYWEVFAKVEEIFLILPAILGLKGNLQMTLASRFSTHSHLGHIQTREDLFALTCANLSMNQALSIVISLSASLAVIFLHLSMSSAPFDLKNSLLVTATALLTSSVTSFLLDILMILVVQVSSRINVNPDNIATQLGSSLGDMTALILISILASCFHASRNAPAFYYLIAVVILFYLLILPFWVSVTQDNEHTRDVLKDPTHWIPLICAMLISTMSGIILKQTIFQSEDIGLFLPVMGGVGGNLVAVQASRLATLLHRTERIGTLPEGESVCMNPINMFTSSKPGYSITRLLISIVIPGQIVFYFFCIYANTQSSDPSGPFLMMYLLGSQVHVIILLYLAYVLTYFMWTTKVDPDNSTIPYLTSIGDVLGACIITLICLVAVPSPPKEV